jgi:hypothetical protein
MIPGIPGGRQFAAVPSSGCGTRAAAARISSYWGVKDGPPPRAPAGAPVPRPCPPPAAPRPPAAAAPRGGTIPVFPAGAWAPRAPAAGAVPNAGFPPPPTPPRSQTPFKSGSFDSAVHSAGVGAFDMNSCAMTADAIAAMKAAAARQKTTLCLLFIALIVVSPPSEDSGETDSIRS